MPKTPDVIIIARLVANDKKSLENQPLRLNLSPDTETGWIVSTPNGLFRLNHLTTHL